MTTLDDKVPPGCGKQPLPVTSNKSQAVTPAARDMYIETITAQEQKGIAKYGKSLETHNGRDAGKDAWDEMIDLSQYLTQLRMEHADALTTLAAVKDVIRLRMSGNCGDGHMLNELLELFPNAANSTVAT